MRKLVFAALMLLGTQAFAQANLHNVGATVGFAAGGVVVGGQYEYMMEDNLGVGGHFHLFPKEDGAVNTTDGYTVVGAKLSAHFVRNYWDFSLSPGFALINIDSTRATPDDSTTFGPSLAIGVAYQFTDQFSVGIENARYYVWLDDDYAGRVIDDLSAKFTIGF